MKYLKLLITGIGLFILNSVHAQVSVNVAIGSPPPWGPVGYTEVRYYYLPDVEAYYDVQTSMFIYYGGGAWVRRTYLPTRYRSYDLYSGYKVVMTDYRGDAPYNNFKEYKTRYAKGYRGAAQKTIGERPAKGNPAAHQGHRGAVQDKGKNAPRSNAKGESNDNNKSMKPTSGHGGGNGKKK
jgi:hypothetical protein